MFQTNFKSNLPATEDEEVDATTELGKVKKLAKMKNAMSMTYMTQYWSRTAMLNMIFNIQAEVGWLAGWLAG